MSLNTALIIWAISSLICLLVLRKVIKEEKPLPEESGTIIFFILISLTPLVCTAGVILLLVHHLTKNLTVKVWDKIFFINRKK